MSDTESKYEVRNQTEYILNKGDDYEIVLRDLSKDQPCSKASDEDLMVTAIKYVVLEYLSNEKFSRDELYETLGVVINEIEIEDKIKNFIEEYSAIVNGAVSDLVIGLTVNTQSKINELIKNTVDKPVNFKSVKDILSEKDKEC